jgi:uncharacterized protein (TIGR02444 family)
LSAERLWDWALRAYAAPGVSAMCLELQDAHGFSVCLLLWAAWAARCGRPAERRTVEAATALVRRWEAEVIGPMRKARRGLKTAPGLSDEDREALRDRVKADELAAERALLQALEALTPAGEGPPRDSAQALVEAARTYGENPPLAKLSALAEALSLC